MSTSKAADEDRPEPAITFECTQASKPETGYPSAAMPAATPRTSETVVPRSSARGDRSSSVTTEAP